VATAAVATMTATEDMAAKALRAPRALPLPGRRRQRAAGERIAALFEEHGRMVYGVCRLVLRDADEAEDAAQQTFLSAYRGLLAGQEPRDPAAWLGTIARNECRKRLGSRRAIPSELVTVSAGDATEREVARRAEIEALCIALAELPEQQRDAVVLREFYGLSYVEVAAALGLSGPAVESLLFRSRRRLQERLRPLRAALGVLTLPVTLRESLAQALPGFGGGSVAAGTGATFLVKAGSVPVAAKLAAAALALGTAGTVAGVEAHKVRQREPVRPEQRTAPAQPARRATSSPRAVLGRRVSVGLESPMHSRRGRGRGEGEHRVRRGSGGDDRSGRRGREQEQPEQEPSGSSGSGHGGDAGGGETAPGPRPVEIETGASAQATTSNSSGPGGGGSLENPAADDHHGGSGDGSGGGGSGDSGSGGGDDSGHSGR
jgi:RNA polymerase sigma-70 factor, ECF subfamily